MEQVVIFGKGLFAQEIFSCLQYYSDYEVVGFTVDSEHLDSDILFDLPVVSFDIVPEVYPPAEHKMLVAISYYRNNRARQDMYVRAKGIGYELVNYISPKAVTYPGTLEGDNCIIGHGTVIAATARVGSNVVFESGCTVGHHAVIGDHCFFSNGVAVAGDVRIGSYAYVGTNATIRNSVDIGTESVIGAGAIILESTDARSVYLGEPATLLPIASDQLPLG